MYVSNWLSTWREHLFGPDAEIDYDTFVTGPRQRHEVSCRVCGSRCEEARAIIATAPEEGPPMLIDRFSCPCAPADAGGDGVEIRRRSILPTAAVERR